MMMRLLLVFYFFLLQVYCDDGAGVDPCNQYTTCTVCVRSLDCQWCSTEDESIKKRCMSIKGSSHECKNIENPKGKVTTTEERDFTSDQFHATQIKPQSFKIKLRPGEQQTFDFSFQAAEDYPADLYFLFDASSTMKQVLQTAADASEMIYIEILKNTKNVQLGMGTFIDKNTAPFVREKVANINSFRHRLDMTSNFTYFKELVNLVQENFTAENHDEPEGGFDALAQVLACKKKAGWRDVSRKIIFFFTDNLSHSAGDGKSAGIVYPYDGKCYTDNGIYTKELELDYPSIGMINELAVREEITIVFIVDIQVKKIYEYLTKNHIRGARNMFFDKPKKLGVALEFADTGNSRNLLENILKDTYESITRKIKLNVDMAPEDRGNLILKFDPDCSSKHGNNCEVQGHNEKRFQGRIKMLKFYNKVHTKVKVSIEGIKETLTLDIEVVDCDCKIEKKSAYCHGHTKRCGICECDSESTGKRCECRKSDDYIGENDESCKQKGTQQLCSGFGYCECGECKCVKGRGGDFCECANENYHLNGHGDCYCGKCRCHEGWTGDNCECHNGTSCILVNEKECNGFDRGECVCGSCQCKHPAKWDARLSQNTKTCEMLSCTDCHYEQCNLLNECAVCRQKNDEDYCKDYCDSIIVRVNETLGNVTGENAKMCENVPAGLGCIGRFQYEYDDVNYKIHVLVQAQNDCTPSYYKWGGIGLGLLLLIAVATLVAWKLLTDLRDRQEYNRFLKSQDGAAAVCVNDIYQPPTTTFSNPAFRKRSVDNTLR